MKKKVYLASPFFNPEQVERRDFVLNLLRKAGYDVFNPQEANFVPEDADDDWRDTAFKGNMDEIRKCDFVVAITSGRDMGTLFEYGAAYEMGKPIIGFAEGLTGPYNLMLIPSTKLVLTSREEVEEALTNVSTLTIDGETFELNKVDLAVHGLVEYNYTGKIE